MTRRSRSSFDLRDALTTAEALSPKAPKVVQTPEFGGVPLVAFDSKSQVPPPPAPRPANAPIPAAPPPLAPAPAPLPKSALGPPPALGSDAGLMQRLNALLAWLRGDPDVSRALVVDDEGLPLVASVVDAQSDDEGLLAATGSVASAMKRLALAGAGTKSSDFEGHVGDGPVLQLIGVTAGKRAFVVGISRKEPFPELEVEKVRAAFSDVLTRFMAESAPTGGGTAAGTT